MARHFNPTTDALAAQIDVLKALIDAHSAIGEGFAIIDHGRVMFANDALCQMSGYSPDELRATADVFEFVHPDDRETLMDRFSRRLTGEDVPSHYRARMVRKDGRVVPVEVGARQVPLSTRVVGIIRDITEQDQIEASLRESEAKFRTLAEMAAAVIFIYQDDRLQYVNRAVEVIGGFSREELLAIDVFSLVSPESRAAADQLRSIAPDQTGPHNAELKIRAKSGDEVWLEVSMGPTVFLGRPAIIGSAFDITKRKQVEQSLRESEERYRLLFERNVVGVFHSTIGGRMIQCNEAFARIFGYASPEQAVRAPAGAFHVSAESRQRFVTQLLATGTLVNWEMEARRGDGRTVWLLEHVTLMPGPDGPDREIQGTVIDITERKHVEEALRASEHRYRELFENANDIIYTHDLAGRFTSLNSAGEQITGYTREEALEMNVGDIVVREHLSRVRDMIEQKVNDQAGVTTYTLDIIAKDGRRVPLEVSSRVIWRDGKAAGVQGIARDLTDRNTLEAQLRQSQKMEAIGRLAGGVAHDFNNMLMAIRGYSELIHQDLRPGDPMLAQVQEIIDAADRAASLTRQLLAFGRKQVFRFRPIDLNKVLGNTERMLRRIIGEDIELVTSKAAVHATINADPGQIEQAIINLAINARDAMPQGGRLMLESRIVEFNASYVRSHIGVSPGPHVMLTVGDTGIGMDSETLSHLFEPFYTTKEVGKGAGLGLSTVYGIVQQSGGQISVTSSPGEGTTFRLYFPQIADEAELDFTRGRVEIVGGRETVLLVEDESSVRHLVRQVLRRKGYHVLEAQHGGDALNLCERHPGVIHLLISDVVMPKMSGRELVSRLREIRPEMKVVYMSGYTDDAIVRHGVSEAGVAFLQKPFTPDVLLMKIRRVLDGSAERQ